MKTFVSAQVDTFNYSHLKAQQLKYSNIPKLIPISERMEGFNSSESWIHSGGGVALAQRSEGIWIKLTRSATIKLAVNWDYQTIKWTLEKSS